MNLPPPNDSFLPVTITYNYTADPLDGITNWPEALGRPLTVTDPMGHVTHYRYDARGNVSAVITVVNGVRRQTDITYNVADQPVQVMYPATTLGRKSMTTTYSYPGGPVTVTTLYDETGAMARQTTAVLGGEGQVKQQTGSAEHASFVLDGLSRLSQLKDGNGNAFQHVYDNLGNLQKLTYPGGGSNTATYDPEGNPLSSTDARNLTEDASENVGLYMNHKARRRRVTLRFRSNSDPFPAVRMGEPKRPTAESSLFLRCKIYEH